MVTCGYGSGEAVPQVTDVERDVGTVDVSVVVTVGVGVGVDDAVRDDCGPGSQRAVSAPYELWAA
jgi:hypothetical protein